MRQLLGKVGRLVIVLFLLTVVSFASIRMLPGDIVDIIVISKDEARKEELRQDLGLRDSYVSQYGRWAGKLVTGDFGKYYRTPGSVTDAIKETLPTSILLMIYTQVAALAIAIPLGVLTAYRANTLFDKGSNIGAFLALSIPGFIIGYLLKKYLAIDTNIFPERGWVPISEDVVEHFRHAVLPVTTLVLAQIAVYFRLLRSDMIATLQEDFITMAKAKGLQPRRILFRHALRPSSLTLLTVAGLNVGTLIGSAVIVEKIYGIDGIGFRLVRAVLGREYVAAQSFIAVIGIMFVLINFLVDFLYTVLDPRIRHAS